MHSAFLQALCTLAVGLGLPRVLCHAPSPPNTRTADNSSVLPDWHWLHSFSMAVAYCHALASRSTPFPLPLPEGALKWDLEMDACLMRWTVQRPEDWQMGGSCDVFLWGGGRHGQLCEAGRSVLTPILAPSFASAQQVGIKERDDHC
jgi:E3 ubiquitin-protein ligase HERC1